MTIRIETDDGLSIMIDVSNVPMTSALFDAGKQSQQHPYVLEIWLGRRSGNEIELSVGGAIVDADGSISRYEWDLRVRDIDALHGAHFGRRTTARRRFVGVFLAAALPAMIRASTFFTAHERLRLLRRADEIAAQIRGAVARGSVAQ
jgi:hypothetical protein